MIGRPGVYAFAAALAGCSAMPASQHPEARVYDASADASADVDAALAQAERDNRLVLIVLGGNWCHDSRALAGWLRTPRFEALITERFELVFVDVGHPQIGEGRNLDIARRFGIEALPGTPSLMVLRPDGTLLNPDTATGWRNAASRSEDEIYDTLASFAMRR